MGVCYLWYFGATPGAMCIDPSKLGRVKHKHLGIVPDSIYMSTRGGGSSIPYTETLVRVQGSDFN